MTRAYKPRLPQPYKNDFLIFVIFLLLRFVLQGLCVSGSMQISHSVPVPSTDSHCKILLVSSSMNSTWLFFLLLFFSSFSLLFSVHLLCAFHTFMLSSLLLYDISSFYWNIKKLTSLYNSVLFFLLHTADFLFHFRKSWQFHLGIAYLLIYCLLFIDLFSDREGESWEDQTRSNNNIDCHQLPTAK